MYCSSCLRTGKVCSFAVHPGCWHMSAAEAAGVLPTAEYKSDKLIVGYQVEVIGQLYPPQTPPPCFPGSALPPIDPEMAWWVPIYGGEGDQQISIY